MRVFKLRNGLTTIVDQKKTDSITIQATVKVGSNNESKKNNGISHFIEHMLFERTKKRSDARTISNEIECLGGILNAYTSSERTCFFIKVPRIHFLKALDILSDIIQNPLFNKEHLEKERKIILKEINLHKDEPRFHQWILFQKTLFKKLHTKNPTYGSVKSVKSLKRNDLLDYYKKFYVPNNIIISVVGKAKNVEKSVKKYFKNFQPRKLPKITKIREPKQCKVVSKKERKKILNSYMVLGYKTPSRLNKDCYTLDVIKSILGRGQSGKMFDEIRNKRGLAYEVGVHHEASIGYGFFSVYLNTDKKNISRIVKIILNEFKNLQNITKSEIKEAKGYLQGQFILDNEDTQDRADALGFWEYVKNVKLFNSYLREINKVRKKDILKVAKKYLTKNYSIAVIEQI